MRTLLALLLAMAAALAAQSIIIVRHAERTGEPDPPLNQDGQRRAARLAEILKDANLQHVYTSDTLRAQQTAAPSAASSGIKIVVIAQNKFEELISAIRATAKPNETTLVVGHRATVPRIAAALGAKGIAPLGSSEHSRIVIVTLQPDATATALTLRY